MLDPNLLELSNRQPLSDLEVLCSNWEKIYNNLIRIGILSTDNWTNTCKVDVKNLKPSMDLPPIYLHKVFKKVRRPIIWIRLLLAMLQVALLIRMGRFWTRLPLKATKPQKMRKRQSWVDLSSAFCLHLQTVSKMCFRRLIIRRSKKILLPRKTRTKMFKCR